MAINNPKYIIFHTSDVSYGISNNQYFSINTYHRDVRQFPVSSLGIYVGYHRLITGGKNIQCRLDTDEGAHCNQVKDGVSMNFQSLGVCIGFDGDVEYPTQADAIMLRDQIWAWQEKYNIPIDRVLFHRDFATNKTCPGKLITRDWLYQLLKKVPKVPMSELVIEKDVWDKLLEILRSLKIIK
jgi:hypothetical protein